MTGLLARKVVLVVGASSVLGRAAAKLAAAEGATVVEAEAPADSDAAEQLVRRVVEQCGRLDAAVNALATATSGSALHEGAEADFDRLVRANVRLAFACMRAQLRQLVSQGDGGSIVNVSGSEGLIGLPGFALESACQHAVIGLTRTAALEFASSGIRANAVCVAAVDGSEGPPAPIHRPPPMRRRADPAEVAEAIVWLCSDRSRFVTGDAMQVDGGTTEAEGQLHAG